MKNLLTVLLSLVSRHKNRREPWSPARARQVIRELSGPDPDYRAVITQEPNNLLKVQIEQRVVENLPDSGGAYASWRPVSPPALTDRLAEAEQIAISQLHACAGMEPFNEG